MIRCSGFTLTPGNPPFSFRISLSLSLSRMCVCILHMCHSLSLFQSFFIFFIRQHGAATYPSLRNARTFQIPVGTTGSAVAMSLSAESNRDTARKDRTKKKNKQKGKKHIRRRERPRREKGEILQRKRSRRNPFPREVDTYTSVSFLRFIQHIELIAGDIRGK